MKYRKAIDLTGTMARLKQRLWFRGCNLKKGQWLQIDGKKVQFAAYCRRTHEISTYYFYWCPLAGRVIKKVAVIDLTTTGFLRGLHESHLYPDWNVPAGVSVSSIFMPLAKTGAW